MAAKMPTSTWDFAAALRDYEETAWRLAYRAQPDALTVAQHLADGRIEITGCDLVALAQYAFRNSEQMGSTVQYAQPAGLELSDAMAGVLVRQCASEPRYALDMEWTQARAVRLFVVRASDDPERLFVSNVWPDHTAEQLAALVAFARSTMPAVRAAA